MSLMTDIVIVDHSKQSPKSERKSSENVELILFVCLFVCLSLKTNLLLKITDALRGTPCNIMKYCAIQSNIIHYHAILHVFNRFFVV